MEPPRSRRIRYRSDQEGAVRCPSLVAGLVGTRGNDRGAVVGGHLLVGGVEVGLVARCRGDRRPEIIGHDDLGDPAVEVEGVGVRCDPVHQLLGTQGLGVEVGRGAEDRHEEFGLETELQGRGVVDGDSKTREVDEHLLAGFVVLAHRHVAVASPDPVTLTELGVAVTIGVQLAVFEPQELQGHPLLGEFLLHHVVVGLGVVRRGLGDVGEETTFELVVVHLFW